MQEMHHYCRDSGNLF